MSIRTPEDWWNTLDTNWQNILDIFDRCGAPLTRNEDGCWWSDAPMKEMTRHPETLIRTLEEAKESRNHEVMHCLLNLCWMAAPDATYIHSWPSWSALCDLCSEDWVFYPEEN